MTVRRVSRQRAEKVLYGTEKVLLYGLRSSAVEAMLAPMQRTSRLLGVSSLGVGVAALALVATAAGRASASRAVVRHVKGRIEALAIDGSRIAYDVSPQSVANQNKVLVWNVGTQKTIKVSGNKTRHADNTSTGSGVFELAIAGPRVAWIVNQGGNTEGDDYLYASSMKKPKERHVATEVRFGDNCAGRSQSNCAGHWLGGLVGSGSMIALNRWTTDDSGSVSDGELDVLSGTKLKQVAGGTGTVEAAAADGGRVVVLRSDGTVGLYSSAGQLLRTVTPSSAEEVALSGHNLVVLTNTRTLEYYNTQTGNRRKTLSVQGNKPGNLDVQGKIAIYTTGSKVHAVNLSSRKDHVIGTLRGGVELARIGAAGVAYTSSRYFPNGATLVFLPFARVRAAVS